MPRARARAGPRERTSAPRRTGPPPLAPARPTPVRLPRLRLPPARPTPVRLPPMRPPTVRLPPRPRSGRPRCRCDGGCRANPAESPGRQPPAARVLSRCRASRAGRPGHPPPTAHSPSHRARSMPRISQTSRRILRVRRVPPRFRPRPPITPRPASAAASLASGAGTRGLPPRSGASTPWHPTPWQPTPWHPPRPLRRRRTKRSRSSNRPRLARPSPCRERSGRASRHPVLDRRECGRRASARSRRWRGSLRPR